MLTPRVKKFLMIVTIIFIIYAIVVSPEQAADVVKSAFATLGEAFSAVSDFVYSLTKG